LGSPLIGLTTALTYLRLRIFGCGSKDRQTTLEAMKRSLRKHWKRITPEFLAPYFNSMPDRMRMIIESAGNRINY